MILTALILIGAYMLYERFWVKKVKHISPDKWKMFHNDFVESLNDIRFSVSPQELFSIEIGIEEFQEYYDKFIPMKKVDEAVGKMKEAVINRQEQLVKYQLN